MTDNTGEYQSAREARLNDAALALIALDPGDLQAIVTFDATLNDYVAQAGESGKDRELIADAAALVAAAIIGERRFEDLIEPIGSLIEQAMAALEIPSGGPVDRVRPPVECEASVPPSDESSAPSIPDVEGVDATPLPPPSTDRAESPSAPGTMPYEQVPEDAELLPDFIAESVEYLEAAEGALLALETDPSDVESVNVIFRAFHTVKGTSGFLGLDRIQELAHHAESLLSRVRDGEVAFVGGVADLSLRASDLLKAVIRSLRSEQPGSLVPLPSEYAPILSLLAHPDSVIAGAGSPSPAISPPRPESEAESLEGPVALTGAATDTLAGPAGASSPKRTPPETEADQSVRVRTDRLDRLVDLVGELVVAQAMVIQDPQLEGAAGADLAKKVIQAGKIVRDLQDLSMGLRMVPFRPAFQKIARVVRDVARKSGKEVDFQTEGEDTEIDRSMVDVIADPLVHMIRNAVDHGLEPPADRTAAGKSPRGTVRLSAYQQGGGVVVELSDDGRGLDPERIFRKAVERGLVDPDRVLSDKEIFALIFAPGFSTAEKVTDLSGRGVGMDVVRRSVESLHGRIEIDSELGKGTRFRVILPLTLAITDGMLIRSGGERYIIPTMSIETSLRPEPEALSSVYEKGEMVLLHGRAVPIVRLHEVFGVGGAKTDPTHALLVVIGEGTARVALLVDELLGQQQFVAKPLGDGLGRVEGLAGGAVLGDGRVGLILDCPELIALARGRVGAEAVRAA